MTAQAGTAQVPAYALMQVLMVILRDCETNGPSEARQT